MASIFDRIRSKAQAAIQGVGNFIDRDKGMGGVQLAQGGLGNRISQGVQSWKDKPANSMVKNYFAPSPDGVRTRDIVRELPAATGEVARDYFVRPVVDSIASLGLSAREAMGGSGMTTPEEIAQGMPNQGARDFLFGDKLPSSIQSQTRDTAPKIEDILANAGVNEDFARQASNPLAFLGVAGITALNAIPDDPTDLARAGVRSIDDILSPKVVENLVDDVRAPARLAKLEGSNAPDFLVNPEGVTAPVTELTKKASKQAMSDIPTPVTELLQAEKQMSLPSGIVETPALPQPPRSLTITQLRKSVEQGYNIDGITLNAKNTDDIREGLKIGLKVDDIVIPDKKAKNLFNVEPAPINLPHEEDALFRPTGTNVAGIAKSKLQKAWDALVPGSRKVIEKAGESGKRIASTLDKADLEGDMTAGKANAELIASMKNLSTQEKKTLADVIEGTAEPISEAQAAAAQTWKTIADDIQVRASAAGLEIGKIDNYFPHHILKDAEGASKDIKGMLSRAAERRYGNLELSRQTDLPYDKDPSVLFDYIEKANKRISDATNFGTDDRVLYNLVNRIGEEGGDANQARKYLDQILGKNQDKAMEGVSQGVRAVESFKLGATSALTNLTQNLSTLMRTDPKSVTKSIGRIISNPDEAIANAMKVGEITPDMARVFANDMAKSSVVGKWLKIIGFTGAEKFNRVMAVNTGIEYSNKLIKQAKAGSEAALRELGRLGFDVKNLDKIEPLLGGKAISQATQFTTKVGELPYGWQTPIGRIVTQFKGFAYKQTGFVVSEARRVGQEFVRGNFKPLTNFLVTAGVATPVVGEIINDLKAVITNKERETVGFDRYLENIMGASSLGLFDSIQGLTGKYGATGVASAALGPAVGDLFKAGDTVAGYASDQEYDKNRATRNIVKSIPGIGATAANTFVPNSYVDNQNIGDFNLGVNEGLNKPDKETYQEMKKTDPNAAESFKERTQATRVAEDKKSGVISKLFSGKETESAVPTKGATPAERKAYDTKIKTVLDEGGTPSPEALKTTIFKGKSASSKSIEERMAAYKALETAITNPDYSEEQKAAIMKASGADPKSAEYFTLASKDQEVRLQELMPKLDNMDEDQTVEFLMQGRRAVGGKQLVNNAMVDYLYENDYISEDAKDAVKALKYDELKDKFYFSKSFAKKGQGSELTYKQAKALFKTNLPKFSQLKSIESLLKSYGSGSQTGLEDDTLLSSILAKQPQKATNNKLWF